MKTTEKLKDAFEQFSPHITRHISAMKLFFEGIAEVTHMQHNFKLINEIIESDEAAFRLDEIWQLTRPFVEESEDEFELISGINSKNNRRIYSKEILNKKIEEFQLLNEDKQLGRWDHASKNKSNENL